MKQHFRTMLVPVILAGCAPGIESVHTAQPEGGTTIVMRTTNKLASACVPEKQPQPIDVLLSTPLAYAGDENAEPEPIPTSDVAGHEEKPENSASALPRDACYPGRKQTFYRNGVQRWRCKYER
jgi:hypothetical protein